MSYDSVDNIDDIFEKFTSPSTFISYYIKGQQADTISFSLFKASRQEYASKLTNQGVQMGDRVIVRTKNTPLHLVYFAAIWRVGAIVVPIDHDTSEEEFQRIAGLVESRFEITLDGQCLIHSQQPLPPAPTDLAVILRTSGTTGKLKGVPLTHKQILANAIATSRFHKITGDMVHFCMMPVHHTNALNFSFITSALNECKLVLQQEFYQLTFWQEVSRERASIVSLIPPVLQLLLEDPRPAPQCPDLKYVISAASRLPPSVCTEFYKRFHVRVLQHYGLSEAVNFSLGVPPELSLEQYEKLMIGTDEIPLGVVFPGQKAKLVDHNNNPVEPTSNPGELLLSGDNVMTGYHRAPEETNKVFYNGWLRTGDLVFREKVFGLDFYYFKRRLKAIIKRNGLLINLEELEERLRLSDNSFEFAIVGFENKFVGEELGIVVTTATHSESINALLKNVFPYKLRPKVLVESKSIAKSSTGKIQRRAMSQLFVKYHNTLYRENNDK